MPFTVSLIGCNVMFSVSVSEVQAVFPEPVTRGEFSQCKLDIKTCKLSPTLTHTHTHTYTHTRTHAHSTALGIRTHRPAHSTALGIHTHARTHTHTHTHT